MDDQRPRPPGIEEQLAQLNNKLKQLSAMPAETLNQRNALLLALEGWRAEWREKGRAGADAPAWRRAVDEALGRAFDGMILGISNSGGGLTPQLLQQHLAPVWEVLTTGLQQSLVDKFGQQTRGKPAPVVDSTDVAAMLATLFGPTKKK